MDFFFFTCRYFSSSFFFFFFKGAFQTVTELQKFLRGLKTSFNLPSLPLQFTSGFRKRQLSLDFLALIIFPDSISKLFLNTSFTAHSLCTLMLNLLCSTMNASM